MLSKSAVAFAVGTVLLGSQSVSAVSEWGQCGGVEYTGSIVCDAGLVCVYFHQWYSQCQKPTSTSSSAYSTSTTSSTTSSTSTTSSSTSTSEVSSTTTTPITSTTVSTTASSSTTSAVPTTLYYLDTKFKAKGKLYWGTASDKGLLANVPNEALVNSEFGQLTPENSMKWDAIEPSNGVFTFTNADVLVDYAVAHGKLIRGHTLVWHSQLPSWVSAITDATTLTNVITNHINNLAGRYAGKIYAWDVVNEVLNDDGTLRTSVFSTVLGESFIGIAFHAARAADPTAKLYINDYSLDYVYAKVTAITNLVIRLKADGVPIDGIGTQCHLEAGLVGGVKSALQLMATANVELAITELDIKYAAPADYTTVTKACLDVPACVGITSWGVSDKDSWRANRTPLLFDENYLPKAAYQTVIGLL